MHDQLLHGISATDIGNNMQYNQAIRGGGEGGGDKIPQLFVWRGQSPPQNLMTEQAVPPNIVINGNGHA